MNKQPLNSPSISDGFVPHQSHANLLTPQDICKMLSISHFTLQKMVQKQAIPHLRLGHRTIRFDHKEIKTWLEKKRVNINPFTFIKVRRATHEREES